MNKPNGPRVSITKDELKSAADSCGLPPQTTDNLWTAIVRTVSQSAVAQPAQPTAQSRFNFSQLAWYAGGVLVMLAMGWFMGLAFDAYGAGAAFGMSVAYTLGFVLLGSKLQVKEESKGAGGVLQTLAVLMTPVTVSLFITMTHLDNKLSDSLVALLLELSLIAVAFGAIRRTRIAFLTAPIYLALWCFSITVAEMIVRTHSDNSMWEAIVMREKLFDWISMSIGLAILASAIRLDVLLGRVKDYSRWGYIFGLAAFWFPLSMLDSGSEFGKLVYFALNVGLLMMSVLTARKVFLVFGGMGSIYYVWHIMDKFAGNGISAAAVLIAMGLGVIYLGNLYWRNQEKIDNAIMAIVPESLRRLLPRP